VCDCWICLLQRLGAAHWKSSVLAFSVPGTQQTYNKYLLNNSNT
jgi:hypothetical protein